MSECSGLHHGIPARMERLHRIALDAATERGNMDLPHGTYAYAESVPTLFLERIAFLRRKLASSPVTYILQSPHVDAHATRGPHLERTPQANGVTAWTQVCGDCPFIISILFLFGQRFGLKKSGVFMTAFTKRQCLFVRMHQQLLDVSRSLFSRKRWRLTRILHRNLAQVTLSSRSRRPATPQATTRHTVRPSFVETICDVRKSTLSWSGQQLPLCRHLSTQEK